MRKGLQLYWIMLLILFPFFFAGTAFLSIYLHHSVQAGILQGFDNRLSNLVTLVGVLLDSEKHHRLMPVDSSPKDDSSDRQTLSSQDPATDPFYLRHVDTITSIRRKTGLTYLYTFHMIGKDRLAYVLDGSEPEDFSPIGQEDTPPEGAADLLRWSESSLTPVVLPVQEWEAWGLFKSGFGPIVVEDGKALGMVGADIPVGIITKRERQATLATILSAIIGVTLTFLVAILASRALVSPIAAIRSHLVKLAGGDTSASLAPFITVEFQQLRSAFATLRDRLLSLDRTVLTNIHNHTCEQARQLIHEQVSRTCLSRIDIPGHRFTAHSRSGTASLGFLERDDQTLVFSWIPPLRPVGDIARPDIHTASSLDLILKLLPNMDTLPQNPQQSTIGIPSGVCLFSFQPKTQKLFYILTADSGQWSITVHGKPALILRGTGTIKIDSNSGFLLSLDTIAPIGTTDTTSQTISSGILFSVP